MAQATAPILDSTFATEALEFTVAIGGTADAEGQAAMVTPDAIDPYETFKMPRCDNDSQSGTQATDNMAASFPARPPANFEKDKLSYLTDRSHAENARMIFSRGWLCLWTT